MTRTSMFKIGNTDLTRFIVAPSYQVNRTPVYTSWTDGYFQEHRDISRYRMTGSFSVKPLSEDSYESLLQLLESSQSSEGYITATLYDNRTQKCYSGNFYLDLAPVNDYPLIATGENSAITITVTER